MLFNDLHDKKQTILSAAHKYGASEVKIFGSVARGEERDNSDVDLLVTFPRGYVCFGKESLLKKS